MRRTLPLTAAALTALAATAFAPATTSSLPAFALVTDDDASTTQPVVLLLGADADAQAAYDAQPVADRYAFASADLGCGDLGGPQDRAAVTALGRHLAGEADGTAGPVAVRAAGVAALQALTAAAADEGRGLFAAVVAEGAYTDPHEVLFSEGGVARTRAYGTESPELPCEHAGATDGTRDAYWAERDAIAQLGPDRPALFLHHPGPSAAPQAQSAAALPLLQAGRDVLQLLPNDELEADVATFLDQHLLDVDGLPVSSTTGFTYSTSCVLGQLCLGLLGGASSTTHLPSPATVELFVNRTFEQDFDCTPACVPGPGTGEIGTLEGTNRFTPPHAPVFTWVDAGANSERVTAHDPLNEGAGLGGDESLPGGHGYHSLAFHTPVLDRDLRLAGSPEVEVVVNTGTAGGTITPILVAVGPNDEAAPVTSSTTVITRGALDLDLVAGREERAHEAGWKTGTVVFDPVFVTVPQGWRLMLVLQSSNVDAFAPGTAQGLVNVATGPQDGVTELGTLLRLPVIGTAPTFEFEG